VFVQQCFLICIYRKCAVKVPTGCLLVQAGKQLEYLTAGYIQSGFHEVTVSEHTVAAIEKAQQCEASLWRVSSTCFAHIASDQVSIVMSAYI
jgi:hypothetical protein